MRKKRVGNDGPYWLDTHKPIKDFTVTQTIISLVIFLFPLAYSPGPGNMFFAANGARFGFAATLRANFGYHVATWIVTAVIGFGFATALDKAPQIFLALKYAGSLYVLWIAWGMFKSGAIKGSALAKPVSFVSGVILLILNPKAYVIIALMFSQFLDSADTNKVFAVLLVTTVFTLNNFAAFIIWTLVGDKMARYFRRPDSAKKLNIMFGIILTGVAVWMLFS